MRRNITVVEPPRSNRKKLSIVKESYTRYVVNGLCILCSPKRHLQDKGAKFTMMVNGLPRGFNLFLKLFASMANHSLNQLNHVLLVLLVSVKLPSCQDVISINTIHWKNSKHDPEVLSESSQF
jgi:hypothetical protein